MSELKKELIKRVDVSEDNISLFGIGGIFCVEVFEDGNGTSVSYFSQLESAMARFKQEEAKNREELEKMLSEM